jgi:hypothetical protein
VQRRNSRQHAERLRAQIRAAVRTTQSARMSTHTRYSEYSRSAHTKLLYLLTQRGEGAYVRTGGTFLKQCLRRRIHDSAALRSELRVLRRKRGNCCREVRVCRRQLRVRRRQLRVRRHELFIPRRQCADLVDIPASCTPRLVRWRGMLSDTGHVAVLALCLRGTRPAAWMPQRVSHGFRRTLREAAPSALGGRPGRGKPSPRRAAQLEPR